MTISRRRGLLLFAAAGVAAASGSRDGKAQNKPLVVFAAASLKDALDAVAAQWGRDTGTAVRVSYAGSNTLATQIAQGAPADVFISADVDWMDDLAGRRLIEDGSRVDLLGNRLVLIAPKDAPGAVDIRPGFDLAAALRGGRLAMANVDAVPAGRYGRAALAFLGAWEGVKDKVAQTENVRAALVLVSRGEAPLGIVYATDAAADAGVAVVGLFPPDSHPPVVYPAALVKGARWPEAAAFLEHLRSPAASAVFERAGFKTLGQSRRGS